VTFVVFLSFFDFTLLSTLSIEHSLNTRLSLLPSFLHIHTFSLLPFAYTLSPATRSPAVVQYAYEAQDETQLSINAGEEIMVLQEFESGWSQVEHQQHIGLFPSNYYVLKTIGTAADQVFFEERERKKERKKERRRFILYLLHF
jgi:hypothetical protein